MAAIGRIDYGLAEGEFWRLTPRQFYEYSKRYAEAEKRRWAPYRFLATVTARAMGSDVDYMAEPEEQTGEAAADVLEAWLRARATNGEKGDSLREPDQAPSTDVADGNGD